MGGGAGTGRIGTHDRVRRGVLGLLVVVLLIGSVPVQAGAQADVAPLSGGEAWPPVCDPTIWLGYLTFESFEGPNPEVRLQAGATHQLSWQVCLPSGYSLVGSEFVPVTYQGEADPVATVSSAGLVTAVGPGQTRWAVAADAYHADVPDEQARIQYSFLITVEDGDVPRANPVPALEIGQTYRLAIDPGGFEIRTAIFQAPTWEREPWAQEYWSGPVIDVNLGTGQVTAREPGLSTVTASITYAAPGSTSTQSMELTFPVRVLTPVVDTGFSDFYGEVFVIPHDDPDDYYSAELEAQLRVGDIVETRINSGAVLSLTDMTTFVVRQNSQVRIGTQSATESRLQLLIGHVWTNVRQMAIDGSMDIDMSQAAAGIKGTLVSFREDGSSSTTRVLRGSVEVTPTGAAQGVMLGAGQQAVASGAGMTTGTFSIADEVATLAAQERQWLIDDGVDPGLLGAAFSFADVSGSHAHYAGIMAVAAARITAGCTAGRFCPSDAVTRDQMATFLNRALELPAAPSAGFTDVNPLSTHAGGIDAVAAAGITAGCTPNAYCPRNAVTRGQMATFLARALNLTDPGPYSVWTFTDVQYFDVHAPGIRAVAQAGISVGLPDGSFGPNAPVTRGQMATFLDRALL